MSQPVATTTLLDTNVYSQLYGGQASKLSPDELASLRVRLERATLEGNLRVVGSQFVFEEIAGTYKSHRERMDAMHRGFWLLTENRLIRPALWIPELPDLMSRHELEACLRRPLQGDERYLPSEDGDALREALLRNEANVIEESGDKAYKLKNEFVIEERQKRAAAKERATVEQFRQFFNEAWPKDDRARRWALIDEWTREEMDDNWKELGLAHFPENRPDPKDMRSMWFFNGYHLARLAEVVGEGRAIERGDMYDYAHYWDAACADELVTDDEGLFRRAKTVGAEGLEVWSFPEWGRSWLNR